MKNVFIAESASVYGNVEIGKNASIWFNVSIRGDINKILIGENSNVQDGSTIHVDTNYPTIVGNGVTIGHNCIIHGCCICDNVLVGMGTTILNGAKISKNTIIGANSLITQNKEFPEGVLIMGSPAKVIRKLSVDEIESISNNANEYVLNSKKYLNNEFNRIK